ncbi:MAG: GNAT family N-acetyltransferase [Planctomycetota bacterium]
MEPYHDPESSCFVLPLQPEPAVVRYEPGGEGVVLFTLVYVPPAHRGTDAARRVLAFAFEHARSAGWKVRPTCSYIAGRYVPRHPEVHDLIAE